MILHTVNKSPFGSDAYQSCQRTLASGDALLLLEDGVYGVLTELPDTPVYAIQGDLQARGLMDKIPEQVTVVDYPEFVQLACEANAVQSWY